MTNWQTWLKGALSAAISGAASALLAINIDPSHFGADHLKHVALIGAIGAMVGLANYLKQSPLAPPVPAVSPVEKV